jgi:uncharacterized membrane protein
MSDDSEPGDTLSTGDAGPTGGTGSPGLPGGVADRLERWVVPVVRWVRRTLWVPIGAGALAVLLAVAAVLVWEGADADGLVLASVVGGLLVIPAVGVALFVRVLGELERLPATVRAAPENAGAIKGDLVSAGGELRQLRRAGPLGVPGALRWVRRTLGRMDALGVAGVAGAVAALHPVRLAWILLLCALALAALPVAALALLLAVLA